MRRTQAAPRPDVTPAASAAAEVERQSTEDYPLNPNLPPEWNMPYISPAEAEALNARYEAEEEAQRAAADAVLAAYEPPPALFPGWVSEAAMDICIHTGLPPRAVPMVAAIVLRYSPLTRDSAKLRSRPGAGRCEDASRPLAVRVEAPARRVQVGGHRGTLATAN